MERCLDLAQKATGHTHPNPMVGSVIVYKNRIIGEGWHHKSGSAHAEVHAINNVVDKSLLKFSTLYVNLEPCSHFGKTPPCASLIMEHQIHRVVIGSMDPNPKVAGKGIALLKASGCEVITGVLENKCVEVNRRFFTFHQKKRPYILLKWAQSIDGFIAPLQKNKKKRAVFWISNTLSQQLSHQWRSEEAAILVGVNTIIDDDPKLTTRHWNEKNPLRIVIDPHNRSPKNAQVLSDDMPTLFLTRQNANPSNSNKEYVVLEPFSLKALMNFCYEREIISILVEGGETTLSHFINENYWDEARVFTAPKMLKEGIGSPKIKSAPQKQLKIKEDQLEIFINKTV